MSEGDGRMVERDRISEGEGAGGTTGKADPVDRPGASGHRFGPDLACSECGILWDVHQRDPSPCRTEPPADAFSRRPSPDFESGSAASLASPASAGGAVRGSAGRDSSQDD